ncbi:cyclopropane-fatty-acyl-phospholipid synthase [Apiospora arundinis]|uniref:N-acetyltransferase domain-containing protein n=1 Tax=Apiospora arundinis TaxID=335852 RepID=A0ABR2IVG3_9PEZI
MAHLTNNSTIVNSSSTMTSTPITTMTTTTAATPNNTSANSTVIELKLPAPARSLVPEKWGDQVRAIGIAEYKEAALSLAQAFASDDLARYLVGAEGEGDGVAAGTADETKWRLHVDIMNYIVAAHCYSGVVTTIGADYDGVALWVYPGQIMDDWWTTLRSGMWRLYWQLSPEGRRRYYGELLPLLHDTKHDVMGDRDEDCYYLVYLGTKPSGRGRGYATKLIEDMAVKADAENRAMYLESSSLKNNAYYAKFGFEAKKDIYMGMDDSWSPSDKTTPPPPVRMTIMVREPQPPHKKHHVSASASANKQQLKSGIMAAAASGHHHHINKQIVCGGGLAQRVQ